MGFLVDEYGGEELHTRAMLYDVQVELGSRSYPIYIGENVLDQVGVLSTKAGLSGGCLVVADEHTGALFGAQVMASLEAAGIRATLATVPAGEPSKSSAQLVELYSAALATGLDRHGFMVALGGGVIGDLAGYAAASFLRGVPFVQVPTSLLAMVDSSVGGKTGINLVEGKNLVGAFHQPALVLADVATLRSLPEREFRAGMAEVVKYGVIRDAAFFERIEQERVWLHPGGDAQRLAEVVGRCCEIKAEVVAADEREGGLRAILNFGHTLGHAIENCAGYGAQYIHGEAIAVGMVYAAGLSQVCCGLSASDAERIERLVGELGLPVRAVEQDWKRLRVAMGVDKKTVGGVPRFVLAEKIGSVSVGHAVAEDQLEAGWNAMS